MRPARILEPTCGSGAFLRAAAQTFPAARALLGIEYQRERYAADLAALAASEPRLRVRYADVYAEDFAALPWAAAGPLLVIGNPPWITTAALGRADTLNGALAPRSGDRSRRAVESDRPEPIVSADVPRLPQADFAGGLSSDTPIVVQPPRSNFKGLRGLAARTGAANFDVAEFLVLKLLRELRGEPLALALLVKESVARNAVAAATKLDLRLAHVEIVRIDARKWFGVSVDACCLLLTTEPAAARLVSIDRRADFDAPAVAVSALPAGADAVPTAIFRQGIKHDAADVFELRADGAGAWRNGYGDIVDVEDAFVFPLCKAGALHAGRLDPTALIVTQARLGEATADLETRAPRLWRYLQRHAPRVRARKSSIYRNAPPFALFGIGSYSFAPWKVAVAGMYAGARFRLLGPQGGRPVMLGDTAYFVPFRAADDARAFAALCATPAVAATIAERAVCGKRPITKALLDALDWPALARTGLPEHDRVHAVLREAVKR